MNRRRIFGPLCWLVATWVAGVIALGSCAPKVTAVDDSFTTPEGIPDDNAKLIVWEDQSADAYYYKDNPPADPDPSDSLVSAQATRIYGPGTVRAMILDRTPAEGFKMFRREGQGGIRQFERFGAGRLRRWLDSQYELYGFVDQARSSYSPPSYMARGVVSGVTTPQSPLTNQATLASPTIPNLDVRAVWYPPTQAIKVKWTLVAGAAYYVVHVYQFRSDVHNVEERMQSGVPAPIYEPKSTDLYAAIVPATRDLVFIGEPQPNDITLFTQDLLVFGTPYLVRVSAIDNQGRMIAISTGPSDPIAAFTGGFMGLERSAGAANQFRIYRLSATTAADTMRVAEPPTGGG